MGRAKGVTEEQLRELPDYATSERFSPLERQVLDYATEMTRTPVEVPEALVRSLREALGEPGLVELTAVIAWENFRARMNHALGIESQGFSEGAFCAVPTKTPAGDRAAE